MVVFRAGIPCDGVPVIAARTDADDGTMVGCARVFPCYDRIVTTGNVNGTGLGAEHITGLVATPIRTDVILGGSIDC